MDKWILLSVAGYWIGLLVEGLIHRAKIADHIWNRTCLKHKGIKYRIVREYEVKEGK